MKLRLKPLPGYGLSILFVGLALLTRMALEPVLGDRAPYMLFILAALMSAVVGGVIPGLLAMVAGQILGDYFFIDPAGQWLPLSLKDGLYWALYNVVTTLCVLAVEAMHRSMVKGEDSMERAKRQEVQLRTIIREMSAAQERIRELASVVESAEDAIISTDSSGKIKSWNNGAERMFGYSSSEMTGHNVVRIIPEKRQKQHSELLARAAGGQAAAAAETVTINKEGQEVDVSLHCSPIRDAAGAVTGVSFIGRDISSAKRATAEIKRLNRDLNSYLQQTRQVMEVLPVGVAIATDRLCEKITLNPLCSKMLGSGEVSEIPGLSAVPSTFSRNGIEISEAEHPLKKAIEENRVIRDWEATLQHPDGTTSEVLVHAAPLHAEDGTVQGAVAAFVDISELRRAHSALRETEVRFRTMADTAPLMIWMTEVGQQHVWVNKTWRTFTGRDNDLETLEGWGEPVHPEDLDVWRKTLEAAIRNKESFELEYRIRRADGEWRWVLDRGVCRMAQDGQVLGFIGSCMDVTEWKKAEEALENKFDELRAAQLALRAQNQELALSRRDLEMERGRYQELFDSAPIGYIITTRQGVIQQVNLAAAEMLHESAKFLEGFPFARLLAKKDRAAFFANIGRLTRRETTQIVGWEASVAPHNGNTFLCAITVNLIEDQERNVLGLRWILRDVTERKEAEERVLRLNAELEQRVKDRTAALEAANRELEAFSYSVSHDLRAPLRSINGFSRAVLDEYADKLDEQGVSYLRYAQEASVRMSRLIDDLLELSRVSRGQLTRQLIDFSALARGVVAELNQMDDSRKVEVDIQPDILVSADGGLLRIALQNLLSNAYKFTTKQEKPRIEVGAFRKGDRICLFVKDNGVGFDMKYSQRLFGVFQRLHTEKEFPGTGIGLATVKRVIARHDGEVSAESRPGEGATFYICLPNVDPAGAAPASDSQARQGPAASPVEFQKAEPELHRPKDRFEPQQRPAAA